MGPRVSALLRDSRFTSAWARVSRVPFCGKGNCPMIVDAHAHVPLTHDANWPGFEWEIPELPPGPLSVDRLVDYVRRSPVDRMIICCSNTLGPDETPAEVMAANTRTKQLVDAAPDVFLGSCHVNPHALAASLHEIERTVRQHGFCAVGEVVPHVQQFKLDSPEVRQIVEKAVELDVGLNLHSSEPEHFQDIARLAADYPRARIAMAHMGGFRFWKTGVESVKRLNNVWVDVSAWCLFCMGALEGTLRRVGAARVLFGTDFPLIDLDAAVWKVRHAGLSQDDQERVFWRNAAHVFGIA